MMTTLILASGFFSVLLFTAFGPVSADPERNPDSQTLIDFQNSSAAAWQIVNDSVMGGISRSTLRMHEEGYALFSGTVSLENNGGFASVRARAQRPADLSDFEGISVRILGDGKTYSLRLRTVKNRQITPYSYQARFTTTAGEWETHHLAYRDFSPVFRGRAVRGNPPLNPDAVMEIGFMIQDGQEGAFELRVRELAVYRNQDTSR